MSLVFSNPTEKNGIVERLRRKTGTYETPEAYPIEEIVSDVNESRNQFTLLSLDAAGKWHADDYNQGHQPIISFDIIAGQRDYSFDIDEDGSMILEIEKVMIADQNKFFRAINPVDPATESNGYMQQFYNNQNVQGIPYRYTKTGNTINFDPIPSYNMRFVNEGLAGGKAYITRESTYYTTSDTSKKSGFPGILDEYLVIHAAYQYADREQLAIAGGVLRNGSITGLLRQVGDFETKIKNYFGNRARDEKIVARPRITRFK